MTPNTPGFEGPDLANALAVAHQQELDLHEYSEQVRAATDEFDPTFKIMYSARGGGYSDLGTMPSLEPNDGTVIVAVISAVFNPRITNITKIEILERKVGEPAVLTLKHTRYTIYKADCVGLDREGNELIIMAGTHETGVPLDENGARGIFIEKDSVRDFFSS